MSNCKCCHSDIKPFQQTSKQTVRAGSYKRHCATRGFSNLKILQVTCNIITHLKIDADTSLFPLTSEQTKMVSMDKSPNKAAANQDSGDVSPQPRKASGALPPQAAQAPEFVPGKPHRPSVSSQRTDKQKGDQKTSETGSDKERAPRKRKKAKKLTKAEEEAQKEQAMEEEWWSGDEIFAPDLKDKIDVLNSEQD